MGDKRPAFQWYPKDYLTDENVIPMTLEEEGAYRRLIDHCWLHGSIPDDMDRLGAMCKTSGEHLAELWPAIEPCFRKKGQRWYHPRLDLERRKQDNHRKAKSEAGKAGAKARWENEENGSAMNLPMAKNGSSFASASATATATTSEAKASGENADVENWEWGDFAGWMRTTGCELLWKGPDPPEWANVGGPWTLARELTIWKALWKRGEAFSTLKAIIERTSEPTCGLHFNQAGRFDVYYLARDDLRKAEAMKGNQLGAILKGMTAA